MEDAKFIVNITYGVQELQTRLVPTENGIEGQGRTRTVGRDGAAQPWSEWKPTGARIVFDRDPEPVKQTLWGWLFKERKHG